MNQLLLSLLATLCLSTQTLAMDISNKNNELTQFGESLAILYGVHTHLVVQHELEIPDLTKLKDDTQAYLSQQGTSLDDLTNNPKFLELSGKVQLSIHDFAPDVESLYGLDISTLPSSELFSCSEYSLTNAVAQISAILNQEP